MTESEVIKLLAIFSSSKPADRFSMVDWIKYLDVTRAGWSKTKPFNLSPDSSRKKNVIAINRLQRHILKLQGEKAVEFMNDDGKIPIGSVCIEAAMLATDASNAALQRGHRVLAASFLRLACDLYSDEVRWLHSQLTNGDASMVEQADSFVSHLLHPRLVGGKVAVVPGSGLSVHGDAGSLRDQLTARAVAPDIDPEPKVEAPVVAPQPLADEGASVMDHLEFIAIFALVVCYEFAVLFYLLPTTPVWQIALVVAAKAVAFRGAAFPSFPKRWEKVLKPIFIVAYLPTIAVGLVGALVLKALAWIASPVFRIAKAAN